MKALEVIMHPTKGFAICGAKKSQGDGVCTQKSGWGTKHVGLGKCKLHGGSSLIKSGRYSMITRERLKDLIEQFEADPNPLDTLPELATTRALFLDYIERYDAFTAALIKWHETFDGDKATAKPRQILDISDAYRIVSEITKIAKRIEDVKAATAVSRSDFYRVMTEMGRVVDLVLSDHDELREKIHDSWMEIRLA